MSKKTWSIALAVTLLSFSACVSQSSPGDVTISITSPTDGDAVAANEPIPVEVDIDGADLDVVTSEGAAHLHITVDGEGMQMLNQATTEVTLTEGDHTITAEFTDAAHESFDPPIEDSVEVTAE